MTFEIKQNIKYEYNIWSHIHFLHQSFKTGRKCLDGAKNGKQRWAGFPQGSYYLGFPTFALSRWWFWSIQANHLGPDLGWVIIFYFLKWEPWHIHISHSISAEMQITINPHQKIYRSKILHTSGKSRVT